MMTNDKRVPLISATGSIRMGKIVAQTVQVVWEDHYWNRWKQCHHRYTDADIKMTVIGAVLEL
jgi:aldehyde dehydrogenase (NAD+)